MLILLGTEEMGSGGRRRRPTVCEELRRRRRRPIDWSARKGRPFFYGGFHWRLRAISERAYCFKFLFGNVFLHSFVCFFCLLSLGLRRLMILVKLVLICYFWFDLPFYCSWLHIWFSFYGQNCCRIFDDTVRALWRSFGFEEELTNLLM